MMFLGFAIFVICPCYPEPGIAQIVMCVLKDMIIIAHGHPNALDSIICIDFTFLQGTHLSSLFTVLLYWVLYDICMSTLFFYYETFFLTSINVTLIK